jgi:hypothetical protein
VYNGRANSRIGATDGDLVLVWETLDDAERALEGPNPAKVLRILRRLAARGNVEAQYRLGLTFEYGQSDVDEKRKIKRDFKQAACWYKQAADNGHHRARDQLWQVYLKEGHHVDEERALTYLLSAAKKGVANAQRFLGTCYMKGNILPVPQMAQEISEGRRLEGTDGISRGLPRWNRCRCRPRDGLCLVLYGRSPGIGLGTKIDRKTQAMEYREP